MEELSDHELLQDVSGLKRPVLSLPTSRAHNERQFWLDLTVQMLKKPFPMIAKKVEGWSSDWIKDLYLEVNRAEVSNPAALWWWKFKNPKQ